MRSYHSLAAPKGKFICFDSIVVEQRLHKHAHIYKRVGMGVASTRTGVHACSIACIQASMLARYHSKARRPRFIVQRRGLEEPRRRRTVRRHPLEFGQRPSLQSQECAKTRMQDWLEASCAQEGGRDGHDPTRVRVGSRGGYLRARCTRFPGTLAGRTCCGHRASVPARPGQCEYERVRGVRQGEEGHVQVHGLAALERPNSPAQGAGFGGE